MKALVIGGNRFFGKRLVALLIQQGAEVTVLNRGSIDDGFGDKITRIKCDRRDRAAMTGSVGNQTWDVIYDQVCFSADEAALACDIFSGRTSHYVMTSSQSVYGPGSFIRESVFQPESYVFSSAISSQSDYAEAKRQAESVFSQRAGFKVTIPRFSLVFGTDDHTGRLLFHVENVLRNNRIFFPNVDARISLLDADDAAKALLFLSTGTIEGAVNCASPDSISLRDILRMIEMATGHTALLTFNPEEGVPSPIGIGNSWYMDTSKLRNAGFSPKLIGEWLPQLAEKLTFQLAPV